MEEQASTPSPAETASTLSAATLRELQERARMALAASREQTARLEADITRQLDELAATLTDHNVEEASSSSSSEFFDAEIARLTSELETSREAWQSERASLRRERDELKKQASELEARYQASQSEWRNHLVDFEVRLREQQSSWLEQRAKLGAAYNDLERERNEIQQKFELALEDVQRLRERVAELEQDLARRPVAAQADSAELVALRAQRDDLAHRVSELEEQPVTPLDPDVEQQMADLQRRFEMAVEDVRELKTKNAKLEAKLAASRERGPAPVDSAGMDWESQKRRLLASLEGHEEDSADPIVGEERASIQGTIDITDAVIAEKDREIAALVTELESARDARASDAAEAHNAHIQELLDTDEVIAEHRARAQEFEREMEAKLRAAELEVSVERAKLAREKAELEELRNTLEQQRQLIDSTGGQSTQGTPKRRWLSKLGIEGKEQ
jgi:chromosome segregation ATPase